jgi:hypothetical protein
VSQGRKGTTPLCSIEGCVELARARGWCGTHYRRWQKWGDPLHLQQAQIHGLSVEDRFWAKVIKDGPVPVSRPELGRCWGWRGKPDRLGYCRFWDGKRRPYAHHFSYELHFGSIPSHLEPDHLCRNPSCVNPYHLEAVTHRVNTLRGESPLAKQARQTHCKRGHPLSGDNLHVYRTRRICRTCMLARTGCPCKTCVANHAAVFGTERTIS